VTCCTPPDATPCPDERRLLVERRRETRAVLAPFVAFGLVWGAWGAVLPDVQLRTQVDDRALGLALVAIAAGALPAMRLAPRIADRPSRLVVPLLGVALVATLLLASSARSLAGLAAALLLLGSLSGTHDVLMNAQASALERERRPILQLAHALFSLGVLTAGLVVGAARQAGAPAPLAVASIAGGVLLAASVRASRPTPAVRRSLDPTPRQPRTGTGRGTGGWRRDVLAIGAAALLASLVENALQSWSAVHLERSLGAPPIYGGLAAGAFAAGAAGGRLLAHRLAARRSLRQTVFASSSVSAVALVVAGVTLRPNLALGAIVVCGAAVSVVLPALLTEAGHRAPAAAGDAIARTATAAYLGFLVGPALVGTIAATTSLRVAYLVLAGIALLVLLPVARLSRSAP
jgi:MFS family permease